MKNKLALIGLGNILLRDEGAGVHAVRILREEHHFTPAIEIVDGGTLGLDLLPYLEHSDRLLFVDAVDFGKEPGYIGEMEDREMTASFRGALSVHDLGLSDLLRAAAWKGLKPERICVIGIQPESVEMGLEMTPLIRGRVEELLKRVVAKLEAWGVRASGQVLPTGRSYSPRNEPIG